MELTPKERLLVDRVIQHIKEFDPQAVVKIADDTLEHEDILLFVYTDSLHWKPYGTSPHVR